MIPTWAVIILSIFVALGASAIILFGAGLVNMTFSLLGKIGNIQIDMENVKSAMQMNMMIAQQQNDNDEMHENTMEGRIISIDPDEMQELELVFKYIIDKKD